MRRDVVHDVIRWVAAAVTKYSLIEASTVVKTPKKNELIRLTVNLCHSSSIHCLHIDGNELVRDRVRQNANQNPR